MTAIVEKWSSQQSVAKLTDYNVKLLFIVIPQAHRRKLLLHRFRECSAAYEALRSPLQESYWLFQGHELYQCSSPVGCSASSSCPSRLLSLFLLRCVTS